MNIFVRGIPEHVSSKQVKHWFAGPFTDCGIDVYHVEKHHNAPRANITVKDARAAQTFLFRYGIPPNPPRAQPRLKLRWGTKQVFCTEGNNVPSNFMLQSLEDEAAEAARTAASAIPATTARNVTGNNTDLTRFNTCYLQCGIWDYRQSQLVFTVHSTDYRPGCIIFGRKQAIILLGAEPNQTRIDVNYHDCSDINMGTYEEPSLSFNLKFPPKIYEMPGIDPLAQAMNALALGPRTTKTQVRKKCRVPAIDAAHGKIAGSCFVYRIVLIDSRNLRNVQTLLSSNAKCTMFTIKTSVAYPNEPLGASFTRLQTELTDQARSGQKPFTLRFQLDRLARNGLLPPYKVMELISKVTELYERLDLDATISAIRRLARDIRAEPPGPSMEARSYSITTLEALLEEYASSYDSQAPDNPYLLAKRFTHINLVHKVIVTPAGLYLEGPEAEPTNRVVRRYEEKIDNFMRVIFQDEDGSTVGYDSRTDQSKIYHGRFKGVLDTNILICGGGFSFLGFSHSSLRNQSCWFMAPFVDKSGALLIPEMVLKELGDFSQIRIPAKCAARIGQNFTDTNATIELHERQVYDLEMVIRNGRDFSDGVGTISYELLQRIWRVYGTKRLLKPTALQIRFQGAKGMVSLDSRLRGQCLMLRSNMKKFETATTWNLEICGAAFQPLPMILNRQFIKIFEDLGISMDVFLELQKAAVERLRKMTESSINTSVFLDESESSKSTKMSTFIRDLGHVGLDYHQDDFLYKVVEMAIITKLQDIKYRGRIPIENGVTLYGIMDETGVLGPNEVYVVTEKAPEGGRRVFIRDRVIVTRSPALHPGDIQLVNAVDVPATSPLQRLSNVIVFSQYGERDLPSQLSGGDLDGDIFNVIWEPQMIPANTHQAADYLRVEAKKLDRPVTRKDMSDFFVTFMESDLLGMISTLHLQLADQHSLGTQDPDCIGLAELASTAVDFSKTGIPVNIEQCPKHDRCRPDFMAPNPRVVISDDGHLDFEDEELEDDDAFDGIDAEKRPFRYYKSYKTLGHLYRAIDERQILASLQQQHQGRAVKGRPDDLMHNLLKYVKHWAMQYGIIYAHHEQLASEIRANYEDNLVNILYDFEPSPHMPLSEIEAFAGHILGRHGGVQGKQLRDKSKTMRERFNMIVDYTTMRITKGDQSMREAEDLDDLGDDPHYHEREIEALPRAVACFHVAINGVGYRDKKLGELKSFKYLAAGVCLRELERYRLTTFGSLSGLPSYAL